MRKQREIRKKLGNRVRKINRKVLNLSKSLNRNLRSQQILLQKLKDL